MPTAVVALALTAGAPFVLTPVVLAREGRICMKSLSPRHTAVGAGLFLLLAVALALSVAQLPLGRAAELQVGGSPSATPTCGPPGFTPWTAVAPLPPPARLVSVTRACYALSTVRELTHLNGTTTKRRNTDRATSLVDALETFANILHFACLDGGSHRLVSRL